MNEEKKWMLMTYYCPTHGDFGIVQPIEITKKEISETFLIKRSYPKNWVLIIYVNHRRKYLNIDKNFSNKVLISCKDNLTIFLSLAWIN